MLDVAPARREAAVSSAGGVAVSGTSSGAHAGLRNHLMLVVVVVWMAAIAVVIALPGGSVAGPTVYPRSVAAHTQGATCVTTAAGVRCGIGKGLR